MFWDEFWLADIGARELVAGQWERTLELLEHVNQDWPWLGGVGKHLTELLSSKFFIRVLGQVNVAGQPESAADFKEEGEGTPAP